MESSSSCLWKIPSFKCPVKFPSFEISCLWNVKSMKCLVSEMSCLYNVLSMKCPIYDISGLWNILSLKCPVYEMLCLWNVLSMKCLSRKWPVYEMSCLWNINPCHTGVSLKRSLNKFIKIREKNYKILGFFGHFLCLFPTPTLY